MAGNLRDVNIDLARGFGIITVVIGHGLEMFFNESVNGYGPLPGGASAFVAWKLIYSFHMPLFFFLSGMVLTSKNLEFRRNLVAVLALYILASALQLLTAPLFVALPPPGFRSLQGAVHIIRFVFGPLALMDGHALVTTWFLVALAGARMLFYVNMKLQGKVALAINGGALLLYWFEARSSTNYFYGKTIVMGFAFIMLGHLYKTSKL